MNNQYFKLSIKDWIMFRFHINLICSRCDTFLFNYTIFEVCTQHKSVVFQVLSFSRQYFGILSRQRIMIEIAEACAIFWCDPFGNEHQNLSDHNWITPMTWYHQFESKNDPSEQHNGKTEERLTCCFAAFFQSFRMIEVNFWWLLVVYILRTFEVF